MTRELLTATWFVFFLWSSLQGQNRPVVLTDSSRTVELAEVLEVFRDLSRDVTIEDVLSSESPIEFRRVDSPAPSFLPSSYPVWARIDLVDSSAYDGTWLLRLPYASIDSITVYLVRAGNIIAVRRWTTFDRPDMHDYPGRFPLFALDLPKRDTTTLLIRIFSHTSIPLRLTLRTAVEYVQADREERFFIGAFYGILLIMILYNVSLFISVRERVYLMYVLYALVYGFYQWIVDGLYFEVFSAAVPYRNWFMVGTGYAFLGFAVLFAREFLKTKRFLPRFDSALLVSSQAFFVLAVLSPFAGERLYLFTRIGWLLMLAFAVVNVVAGVVVYRKGYRPAGIYILAASGMIAGFLIRMLRVAELIPYQQILEDSVKLGFLWELSFLSVALGNRIREYREQRERERQRIRSQISRDLHDEVGSDLSSIALSMEMLASSRKGSKPQREDLARLSRLARQATESLRDIVWLTNPARESAGDFVAKIIETARRILGPVQVTFDIDQDQLVHVGLGLRRNLFLTIKESLTNIARHADATAVAISFRKEGENLILVVHDDGKGFDPSRRIQGSGLSGMQLRAEAMGGRFGVESSPGGGSTVRVTLPLRQQEIYEIP